MSDFCKTDNVNQDSENSFDYNFFYLKKKLKLDENIIRLLLNSEGSLKNTGFKEFVKEISLKI